MKENTAVLHAQVPVDVATYLLNEKRSEIHAIEARLKVSVILIPNVHLETPNYSISRLRHDDVKLGEVQTSYQLVEKPAQEISLPSTAQEAKPVRQQAAVRGITPSQPAPMRERKPQLEPQPLSLVDKIFGWFKQMGVTEKNVRPEPVAAGPQRPERGHGRRDRGREGRDSEVEKTPRLPQRARDDRAERGSEVGSVADGSASVREAMPQRPERGDAKPQGERAAPKKHPRPPRDEKARADVKSPEQQPVAEDAVQQSEDGGRRRRRGGRQRDRGERLDRGARETKQVGEAKDSHAQQASDQVTHDEDLVPAIASASMASTDETPALILASTPPQEAEALIESSADLKDTSHPEPLEIRETGPIIAPEVAASVVAASVPIAAPSAPEGESETEPAGKPGKQQVVQESTEKRVEEPVEELTRELKEEAVAVNLAASIITTPEPFRGEAEETKEETAAGAIETAVPFSVVRQQDAQLSQPSQVSEPMNLGATGLIMIETHPEKIKPVETDAEGEATQVQRRRKRTAPPPAVEQHEPLVQVETHK